MSNSRQGKGIMKFPNNTTLVSFQEKGNGKVKGDKFYPNSEIDSGEFLEKSRNEFCLDGYGCKINERRVVKEGEYKDDILIKEYSEFFPYGDRNYKREIDGNPVENNCIKFSMDGGYEMDFDDIFVLRYFIYDEEYYQD